LLPVLSCPTSLGFSRILREVENQNMKEKKAPKKERKREEKSPKTEPLKTKFKPSKKLLKIDLKSRKTENENRTNQEPKNVS